VASRLCPWQLRPCFRRRLSSESQPPGVCKQACVAVDDHQQGYRLCAKARLHVRHAFRRIVGGYSLQRCRRFRGQLSATSAPVRVFAIITDTFQAEIVACCRSSCCVRSALRMHRACEKAQQVQVGSADATTAMSTSLHLCELFHCYRCRGSRDTGRCNRLAFCIFTHAVFCPQALSSWRGRRACWRC
jgi:hypothetical protein